MEDRGRHRIGISQNQPHINADVAPQKYNGTEGLLQENARRMVALLVLNYHVFRHRVGKCKSAYSCFVNFITF
jgi:hypothetical protein